MALLENQTVLLIAPQPWNHIHLSKHHYAIELARRGNAVYYLDPDWQRFMPIDVAPLFIRANNRAFDPP